MRHKRWEETVEIDGETGGVARKEGTYALMTQKL